MRGSLFDDIPVLSPEQAEKERQVQSQGFQHYRDSVLRALSNLTFSEKFRIIFNNLAATSHFFSV